MEVNEKDSFNLLPTVLPTGSVTCPNCQNRFEYFGSSASDHFGCISCKTFFYDARNGQREVLRKFTDDIAFPDISIGSACLFDNDHYVVTSVVKKREWDNGFEVKWNEYDLYSSSKGYINLAEFSGHWMLVTPLKQQLAVTQLTSEMYHTQLDDIRYNLYHSYSFDIVYAAGSFEGNILENEKMHTWEYIAPPLMVITEQLNGEQEWFQGKYLQPAEVATAFQIPKNSLPPRSGVGVIQPSPYAAHKKAVNRFSAIMVGLLVVTFLLVNILKPSDTLLSSAYPLIPDTAVKGSSRMIVTPPFKLSSKGSVEVELKALLSNEWLEAGISMINDDNGSAYDLTKSLERYSGTDGGESWSEGSGSETALLAGIPAGNYHLNIYPYSEKPINSDLNVIVESNPIMWSNFFIVLLIVLIVPVSNSFLDKSFEQKRLAE